MTPWKRYLLATLICIVGGIALAFVVALAYVIFEQPPLEGPLDVALPQYLRPLFAFGLIFAAVYLSSFLLSPAQRRRSSILSGTILLLSLAGIAASLPSHAPFVKLAIAIALDMLPVLLAVILAALLHSNKSTLSVCQPNSSAL